jgi:RNA polymerase sigma factor for flagellar operon FliA
MLKEAAMDNMAAESNVGASKTFTRAKTKRNPAVTAATPVVAAKSRKAAAALARRNDYATKHVGLVDKVAKRLARKRHVRMDELISAGMIGLLDASARFDPERNDRFESFAEFRIRGAMLDDLRARDSLSRDMRRICNELADATANLANQLGRAPSELEVAECMGISVDEIRARQGKLSGQSVVGFDDADPAFLDRVADDGAANPYDLTAKRELFGQLVDHIEGLPERMQQVLSLYYCEDLNLKEIAAVLGVTESRICQIHTEATRRLRGSLGDDFIAQMAA